MKALRLHHAGLAILVVAAYLSGEAGLIHAWLGYAVAALIAVRLVMAVTGAPQLGLARFYPHFAGLKLDTAFTHPAISRSLLLGIALCTIGATGTGLLMDRGQAIGMGTASVSPSQEPAAGLPHDGDRHGGREAHDDEDEKEGGVVGEIHEFFANLLLTLVAAHIIYLLLFKRPLARFMLFLPPSGPRP